MQDSIPRDFHELVQRYESVFDEEIAGNYRDSWRVAATLIDRGSLRDIKLPSEESILLSHFQGPVFCRPGSEDPNDLCSIVGIEYKTWVVFAEACRFRRSFPISDEIKALRPKPLDGGCYLEGPFDLRDVLRLRLARDQWVNTKMGRRRPFRPSVLLPIEDMDPLVPILKEKIQEVLKEEAEGYVFERPDHLPKDNDEIYSRYNHIVTYAVRRYLRFGVDPQDAINEVWLKLINTDILSKFIQSSSSKLPTTLSVEDAVDFLGVSWDQWCDLMDQMPDPPLPLKGAAKDPKARFHSSDIQKIDKSGYIKHRNLRRLPEISVSESRFLNYLKVSARNHIKNLFRTQERHFNKESTLGGATVLSKAGDVWKRKASLDEESCWEASLTDDTPLVEETLDGYTLAYKLGVEYDSTEYYQEISNLASEFKGKGLSIEEGLGILTQMAEGIPAWRATMRERRRVAQMAG